MIGRGVWIAIGLTACGDNVVPEAADAGLSPPIDPSAVPVQSGEHQLVWTCESGCEGGASFAAFDRLIVDMSSDPIALTYRRSSCPGACDVPDVAMATDNDCYRGEGIPLGEPGTDAGRTDPYELCPSERGPSAQVVWRGFPGPKPEEDRVWRLVATPM